MSDRRSQAQQERRARERQENHAATQAAKAAEAAAARAPDGPIEFQPDPNASTDAFAKKDDSAPREIKRGNPVRNQAYEQIMADRQAQAENTVHEAPRPEPTPAAAPSPEPEPAPAPVAAVQPQEPEPAPEPALPETVRVKIDGVESEVAKSEVDEYGGVRAYQIIKAQEKRLKEASQYASELGRMFEQAKQVHAPPQPQRKPEEELQEVVQKIQFGTPEEGAAALQQALQRGQLDAQAVAFQAFQLTQITSAENAFVAKNADLLANPMLKNFVISEKNRRLGEYQAQKRLPDDWGKFYDQIALDVRAAFGRPTAAPTTAQPPAQPTSGVAEKEARKASISVLPTAATRAAVPEAEKPLTRDDILARARKARGQPV